MVLGSGNHWKQWFSMVFHHWSNNGMVTYHRWSLVLLFQLSKALPGDLVFESVFKGPHGTKSGACWWQHSFSFLSKFMRIEFSAECQSKTWAKWFGQPWNKKKVLLERKKLCCVYVAEAMDPFSAVRNSCISHQSPSPAPAPWKYFYKNPAYRINLPLQLLLLGKTSIKILHIASLLLSCSCSLERLL